MAMSGSLKTLFESRTSSNVKSRTSTATPVIFVPPSYFKVDGKFLCNSNQPKFLHVNLSFLNPSVNNTKS